MQIIAFVTEGQIIRKIIKYLDLWEEESAHDPPVHSKILDEIVYLPIEDVAWEHLKNPE